MTDEESTQKRDPESTYSLSAESTAANATPRTIDAFRILEQLGSGGMGEVYLAEQREPIRRRVAIKVIKLGMDSKEILARFEAERQALALMDHPGIAKVLEAGSTETGRPFVVMELVSGVPITEYCDTQRLTTIERLYLFQEVCDAVQHAHFQGVIHRDLKPSNILVTTTDGKPTPKVIDFGLAKATSQPLTNRTLHTEIGQLVGTPAYMSPEQIERSQHDIDSRSDVYSLGVLLYELLVGELPFSSQSLRKAGFGEVQRIIREVDPPRPSTKITILSKASTVSARNRRTNPEKLQRELSGDLDWITMRALEKDRTRRYGTATELSLDLSRYLNSEPVTARPPSISYRVKKFVRKHRIGVSAAAAVLLAVVLGLCSTSLLYLETQDQLSQITRLSDSKRLELATRESETLWPAYPEKIPAMRTWLEEARELEVRLPLHEETLEELRELGRVGEDDNVEFSDEQTQWQYDTLHQLITNLHSFTNKDPYLGVMGSVLRRLEFAETVLEQTTDGKEAREAWKKAIADIRTLPVYQDLELSPQIGLIPLGRNPRTGLHEFWHVQTGEKPTRDPNPDAVNLYTLEENTGMVFVLLPGRSFHMGAQGIDSQAPNYDPEAQTDEMPVHIATLDPFFCSKYEMTQGQWLRFTGENPSAGAAGFRWKDYYEYTLLNPVESVTWIDCERVLFQLGLELPTEAQWEYAARGGTGTPWFTGHEKRLLDGACNLADQLTKERGYRGGWKYEDFLRDGWAGHSPVGSFRANPFGLHDTVGNLWEWCRDPKTSFDIRARPGDGYRESDDTKRCIRGGGFSNPAMTSRVSNRDSDTQQRASWGSGVRPVRRVSSRACLSLSLASS